MGPNPQFPADWSHVLKKSLMKTSFFVQCDILIGTKSKFFKVSLEVSQIEDTIKFQSYFNVGQKVTPKLVLATLLFKVGDTTLQFLLVEDKSKSAVTLSTQCIFISIKCISNLSFNANN